MKTSTIVLGAILILFLLGFFGVLMPWMVSAASTALVVGGILLAGVVAVGLAILLNNSLKEQSFKRAIRRTVKETKKEIFND